MSKAVGRFIAGAMIVLVCPSLGFSQIGVVPAIQRIEVPITIDGYSDEAVWETIAPLPLTMGSPVFRGEMTERTEIRLAYDDNYFYIKTTNGWGRMALDFGY